MKLQETKKVQNVFKSNLNERSREGYKSYEQKGALQNIKSLYESREPVIKLFNDYSSIAFEAKYKIIHGKRIPSMLACVAGVAKFNDLPHLLTPKLNASKITDITRAS